MQINSRILIISIFLSYISGCQLFPSSEKLDKWDPGFEPPPPPIEMTLQLSKKTISQDEILEMTLNLYNPTQDTLELILNYHELVGGYYYDFNVAKFDSSGIWDRIGDIIIQTIEPLVLKPGEIRFFTHEWDITYNFSETKVFPGRYIVWGNLYGSFPFPPRHDETDRISIRTPIDTLTITK